MFIDTLMAVLSLLEMNMSQIELVIPALWADAGLPEVARIPGGLRGPGSNPKAASSLKGDHLKLKTWIEKCGKGANGEELHLLDFSTFPRAISQSTQIMSCSETAKKHLKTVNKFIAAFTNLSVKEVWGERGHFEESRICHLGFKSCGPTN